VATPDGVSCNHGDDGLWQTADLNLQVQYVQAWDGVLSYIATFSSHRLVAATAESQGTFSWTTETNNARQLT